jgi:hypothetical protein
MPEDAPWRTLLEEAADDLPEVLRTLEMLPDADAEVLPSALGGVSEGVIGQVIVKGPQSARTLLLEPLARLFERALEAEDPSPVDTLGMLATAGVLAASGGADTDPHGLLGRSLDTLLERPGDLTDQEFTSLTLASAALGFDEAVAELVGSSSFVPGREFGPDVQGYARYLVAAVAAGADTEDVEAAWEALVATFPLRLETGGLGWSDLLWAGYGAYTRIFGYEPGEVAQGIHEYVQELAAE